MMRPDTTEEALAENILNITHELVESKTEEREPFTIEMDSTEKAFEDEVENDQINDDNDDMVSDREIQEVLDDQDD